MSPKKAFAIYSSKSAAILQKLFFEFNASSSVCVVTPLVKATLAYVGSIDPRLLPLKVYEVSAFASLTSSSATGLKGTRPLLFVALLLHPRVHAVKSPAKIFAQCLSFCVQIQGAQHLLVLVKYSVGWSMALIYVDFFHFCSDESIYQTPHSFLEGQFSESA